MKKRIHSGAATFLTAAVILAVFAVTAATRQSAAQSKTNAAPYDSIAADGENYAGPERGSAWDERGSTIYIGLLAPLHGPEMAEGEALAVAAKMALQDSTAKPMPDGRRIELTVGDESGPAWGHVSDVILQLVLQRNVVALITSTDGTATHVSEQVGNRIGVPILTLSSDSTSTQIDIPWIFRVGPSDTQEAQSIAQNIYREYGMKKVTVISEADHDGRGGFAAMRQAAVSSGAPAPDEVILDPLHPDFSAAVRSIQADPPQAIVLWTQSDISRRLLSVIQGAGLSIPVYFSQQAAQAGSGLRVTSTKNQEESPANRSFGWKLAVPGGRASVQNRFAARYQQQTGTPPSSAAAEAYDAVCLTVRALRSAGPNRARVRDQLARTHGYSGASGSISFDREGNNTAEIHLVSLQLLQPSTKIGDSAE